MTETRHVILKISHLTVQEAIDILKVVKHKEDVSAIFDTTNPSTTAVRGEYETIRKVFPRLTDY